MTKKAKNSQDLTLKEYTQELISGLTDRQIVEVILHAIKRLYDNSDDEDLIETLGKFTRATEKMKKKYYKTEKSND